MAVMLLCSLYYQYYYIACTKGCYYFWCIYMNC